MHKHLLSLKCHTHTQPKIFTFIFLILVVAGIITNQIAPFWKQPKPIQQPRSVHQLDCHRRRTSHINQTKLHIKFIMSSERSIPHLRDIFSINGYTPHTGKTCGGSVITATNASVVDAYNHDKKQSRKKRDNNKTLTSGDVKTLERHLSMKKTIRKKIMRDLQQAFVDDPNEFQVENANAEHMKAELKAEAIRFGENPTRKSDNFLVMLRGGDQGRGGYDYNTAQNREYDYDAPAIQQQRDEKQSFWKRFTMKNKTKR